jgi:hypothetical protein
MYPYALSPRMAYYVKDNFFEDWGYQGHPKHWKFPNQKGGVPRWIQFNNNGGELDRPAKVPPVELVDAKQVYDLVLARAGCWPRDRVTRRTVAEVKNKTGAWGRNGPLKPSDEWFLEGLTPGKAPRDTDGDGMPDAWEKAHGLDPKDPGDATRVVPAGQSANDRHRGYTYIEFYINELADRLVP